MVKVVTLGGYEINHWVTSYSLSHSVDGCHWAWYRLCDGQIKVKLSKWNSHHNMTALHLPSFVESAAS